MLAKGGTARVYAMPEIVSKGEKINNQDIYFKWEIDGQIDQEKSGPGRDYIDVYAVETGSEYVEVIVTATPKNSNEEIQKTERIPISNTESVVYEKGAASKRAIYAGKPDANDFVLVAEPYFFSLGKDLSFVWDINGVSEVGSKEKGFKIKKTGSVANIKVKLSHAKKIFQEASSELSISF
jgi:hypothetical protein